MCDVTQGEWCLIDNANEYWWDTFSDCGSMNAGAELLATVKLVRDFGVIVDVLRGREGLVHMTEISHSVRGLDAPKLLKEGDTLTVKVLGADPISGSLKLSRKAMLDPSLDDPLVVKVQHLSRPTHSKSSPSEVKKQIIGQSQPPQRLTEAAEMLEVEVSFNPLFRQSSENTFSLG